MRFLFVNALLLMQEAKAWRRLEKELAEDGMGDDMASFLKELDKVGSGAAFQDAEDGPSRAAGDDEEDDDDGDDLSSVDTYDSE